MIAHSVVVVVIFVVAVVVGVFVVAIAYLGSHGRVLVQPRSCVHIK